MGKEILGYYIEIRMMKVPPVTGHDKAQSKIKIDVGDKTFNAWKHPNSPHLGLAKDCQSGPIALVHTMLFTIERVQGYIDRSDFVIGRLRFFLGRVGGLHLLLLLLNAYYNKTPVGRMPGWTFGKLEQKIEVSSRGLRTLIKDAMDENLILQQPGQRDRRCKVYMVTDATIGAWEELTGILDLNLSQTLASMGNDSLANIDYRKFS